MDGWMDGCTSRRMRELCLVAIHLEYYRVFSLTTHTRSSGTDWTEYSYSTRLHSCMPSTTPWPVLPGLERELELQLQEDEYHTRSIRRTMENSKQATMDNQSTTATLPSVLERADSGGSTSSAISARSSSACSSLFSQAGGAGSDEERRSSFASSVFVDDKEEAEEDILEGSVTPSPQLPDAIPSSLSMHPVLDSSDSSRPSSSSDGASSHGSFISTTDMATPTAELYALSLQPLTASSALSSPVTAGPNSSAGGGPSASSSSATSSTKTPTSSASTDTNKLIIDTSSVSIQRSSAKGTLPPATSPEMLRFAQRVASRGIPLFPARSNSHSHMQSSTMNSAKAVAAAAAIVASSSSSGGRIMKAEGFPWTARPSSYTPRSASLSSSSSKPPHTGQSYNASSSSSSASKSAKALVATPSAIFSAGEDESEDETEALSSLFPSTYSTRPATSPSSSSSSSFNFNANGSTALHHAMRNSQSCAGSNAVHPLSSNSSSNATIRHSHCSSNNTTNESTASTTMLSSSSYRFGNGGNGEPGSSDVSLMSPTNTYSTIKMNHGESDRQAQRTDVELHQDYDMDEGRNAIELKRDIRSGHSSTPRTRSTGTSSSTTVGAAGSGGILQGQGAPASSSSSSGCIGSSSEMKHCGPARPAAGSSSSSSSFSSHTPQQQQHLSEDKSSTTSIDRKKKDATVSTASSSSLFRYEAPMAATMVLPSCASISVPPPPPSTTNRQETVPLSLSTRLGSHHSLPPVLSSSYGSIDASKKNAGGGDVTGTVADGLNSNFTSLSSKSKESAALSLPTSTSVLDSNNARAKDAPKNTTRNASLDYSDARGNLYTSHLNSLNYHAGMNDNTYSSSPSSAVTAMNNMHNGTSVGAGVGGRPATASSIYGISTTSTTTRPWIRDSDASSVRSSSGLSSEGSSFDGQYYGNGNSDIEPNVMSPAAPPPVPCEFLLPFYLFSLDISIPKSHFADPYFFFVPSP